MKRKTGSPSSGAALELVKDIYRKFASGAREELTELVTEDFEWRYCGPSSIPWAGVYRGPRGVTEFFARVEKTVELERFDPREFIDGSDRVVVIGSSRARVRASGKTYESTWVNVFKTRDGRVSELLDLYDTAEIVRALDAGGA